MLAGSKELEYAARKSAVGAPEFWKSSAVMQTGEAEQFVKV